MPARAMPCITSRENLTLGLLTPHNPFDAKAFSGTAHFAAEALGRLPDTRLRILGPHRPRPAWRRRLSSDPRPDAACLDLDGVDAIVGLVASPLITALPQNAPVVLHVTDATPAFLGEFYGRPLVAEAQSTERRAAVRAARVVYSSAAMARRAGTDLGLGPDLAPAALPFGINLAGLPEKPPAKPSLAQVELLFVGLDWTRKGGDLAVATLDRLTDMGVTARLTVVGRPPDRIRHHRAIRVAGFLDKNRPRDLRRLKQLYAAAHLLVLPTRGDCTPMVIAEAMAHATPTLATDTGGVAELVGAPGAGRTLPLTAGADDWARAIVQMTCDAQAHALMSDAAFDRARDRFSWDAWARGIKALADETLAQNMARAA